MITVQNISFRIYGGSVNGGLYWQPFVAVGDVPQEFVPKPPVLVNEQQVWMITHAQNYTLYTICSKRCYTQDGQQGLMLISLFLPPQQRLADGKSPLDLLGLLMDCFAVHAIRDGKLPEGPVNNAPFVLLLEEFRLEKRPMLLPIMQGQEPAAFCLKSKAQLDALMRHSRYPVLANVGRLELGFECESTISLNTSGTRESKEKTSTPPIIEGPSSEQPPVHVEPVVVEPPAHVEPVVVEPPAHVEPVVVEPPVHVEPAAILDAPTDSHPSSHVSKTYESSALGGLSLDDTPIVQKPKTGSKIATGLFITIGFGVVCLFGFFILISVIPSGDDKDSAASVADSTCVEEVVDVDSLQLVVEEESFVNDIGDYIYTGPVDGDGMPHGIGEAKFASGRIYNGPFDHGVLHGQKARMQMENGDLFEGLFVNNEFASGKYTFIKSGNYFVGTYNKGDAYNGVLYNKNGEKIGDVENGKTNKL